MPSVIIHRCVSKRILEKTNLFTNELDKYLYDIGTLTPDSWRNTKRFMNSLLPKKEKRKYSHFSNDDEFIEGIDSGYVFEELDSETELDDFNNLTGLNWSQQEFDDYFKYNDYYCNISFLEI